MVNSWLQGRRFCLGVKIGNKASPYHDALVQGVAGHDLPVVEDLQAEGLALRVRAQVRLEAERVYGRHEGLDRVQRRAGDGRVLRHVAYAGKSERDASL